MAFNGNGVFVRLYNWVNDAASNIKIRADRMDNEMDGMATGLSTCITKDGQTTPTGNLPMAGFRHTGVGDAGARSQYASFAQLQDAKSNWVVAAGTADVITAAYSIPITVLVDGQECNFRASAANATTTPTFSPNSLTARTITKIGGTALAIGDIPNALAEVKLRYNLVNTRWELVNVYTAPSATAPFIDSTAIIKGSSDATKLLRIEVDGFTTATTRVVTVPDADLTMVGVTTTQTLTNKTLTGASIDSTSTGVTQAVGDNSTKFATTAYVDRVGAGVWTSYSPGAPIGQTNGLTYTNITTVGYYRLEGKQVHLRIRAAITGAPGTGTGYFLFNPPAVTVDTTALFGATVQQNICGTMMVYDVSATTNYSGTCGWSVGASAILAYGNALTTPVSPTVPITLASGDFINLDLNLPII